MKRQSGLSLVELLVAAVLLTGVMGLVFTAFSTAANFVKLDQGLGHYVARNLLESLHEYSRQDTWNDAANELTEGDYPGTPEWEAVVLNGKTYERKHTVSAVSGRDYRKVDVTVQWSES